MRLSEHGALVSDLGKVYAPSSPSDVDEPRTAAPLSRRRARALAAAQPAGDPAECVIPAGREPDGKVGV
jgi:hypothetical protein